MQNDHDSRKGCYCRSQGSPVYDSDDYVSPPGSIQSISSNTTYISQVSRGEASSYEPLPFSMFNDISGIFSNSNLPSGLEGNL